jgi:hypothetical protein
MRSMIGHSVSNDRAADSADDKSHRTTNDRPANRAGNGASYRAIFIGHGGYGKRERHQNGGRP